MVSRLAKLRQQLPEQQLEAVLISQPTNLRYLSGFTGSEGYLLISLQKAILAVDFRYQEQARLQAPDFQFFQIKRGFPNWFPGLVSEAGVKRMGLESDGLTLTTYHQFIKAGKRLPPKSRPQLVPAQGIAESLRQVKDEEELNSIEKAAALADAAEEYARNILRAGMTERELAWKLEKFLRERGSEKLPFDVIVASGPNSALPHAQPSDRTIQQSEPVIIDLGARVSGYCSDMTRTICPGELGEPLKHIYRLIHQAQLAAIENIRAGMSGEEADSLAREIIKEAGYGEEFGHGLGHGVGLDGHEKPRLGPDSRDVLENGMAFTVEPGIYIEGWGGVRIEDMILLEKGKARVITNASKLGI